MGLPVEVNPLFLENQYAIQRSLRFRQGSSNNAYLNRTPGVAGNQKTWAWSGWVKRGSLGSAQIILSSDVGTSNTTWLEFGFDAGDTFTVTSYAADIVTTSAVFRDPSAWYHLVVAFDSTQATSGNRCKIYFNNVQQTLTGAGFTLNAGYGINSAQAHAIGYRNWSTPGRYFDGYLGEVNFIDTPIMVGSTNGTTTITLTSGTTTGLGVGWNVGGTNIPSGATITSITSSTQFVISSAATGTGSSISFGATPPLSAFGQYNEFGVWSPRKYGGSYGTNGFYLPFTNTTSATTLCYDQSNGTGALTTPYAASLSGTNSGWAQFGIRSVVTMGSVTQQGKAVRVTFAGGSSGLTIYGAAFGKQATSGNAWDFSGDQVTLTFSGSASATVSANSTLTSDWIYYPSGVNSTGVYVIALAVGVAAGTTQFGTSTTGSANLYYKSGDYNVGALTTAPSGYTLQSSVPYFFAQVDVQGNNWTPNNISTTAGTTYDAMTDVPTPSTIQNVAAGNYCVLNPLDTGGTSPSAANLQLTAGAAERGVRSTFVIPTSGLWYGEATVGTNQSGATDIAFGLAASTVNLTVNPSGLANVWGLYGTTTTNITRNGTSTLAGAGTALTSGEILQFAIDLTNNKGWIGRGNVWFNGSTGTNGDPATGANPTFTFSSPPTLFPHAHCYSSTINVNFGQRPFAYTPPSGFRPLNTNNLPSPTIPNGARVMAATLYEGTGSNQTIVPSSTNSGNNPLGLSFQPDFLWIKSRSAATNNRTYNIVATGEYLVTNSTAAAVSSGTVAIQPSGFIVGTDSDVNNNTATYVGWQWNAGSGASTVPSGGSITPTGASINVSAGFSIIAYTGTGSNATVPHGLGATPAFIMIKDRTSSTNGGAVYHTNMGATKFLKLFQTTTGSDGEATDNTVWNGGSPTFNSSVFSVGTNVRTNTTDNYIAYIWTPVSGYSAFGSYTGNGLPDGPFVYTGFRPRWLLVKRTDAANDWVILDSSRNTYNSANSILWADLTDAETSGGATTSIDFLSNGFKPRGIGGSINTSSGTYIYAAFAENNFKFALAR